jgi:hypothetical protein
MLDWPKDMSGGPLLCQLLIRSHIINDPANLIGINGLSNLSQNRNNLKTNELDEIGSLILKQKA